MRRLLSMMVILLAACTSTNPTGPPPTATTNEATAPPTSPTPEPDASPTAAPAQPLDFTLMARAYGATNALALEGERLYLGVGAELVTLDVSDPANPVQIGDGVNLGVVPDHIIVRGGTAYAVGGGQLETIDLEAGTVTAAQTIPGAEIADMLLRDDILYMVGTVADVPTLLINDVTREAPLLSQAALAAEPQNAVLLGDALFYTTSEAAHYLDVSDPATPTEGEGVIPTSGPAVTSSGTTLIVQEGPSPRFYNVSDPANPLPIDAVGTQTEVPARPRPRRDEYTIDGATLFTTTVEFIDVVNIRAQAVPLSESLDGAPNPYNAGRIAARGGAFYVAGAGVSIYTVDVTDVTDPSISPEFDLPGEPFSTLQFNETSRLYVVEDRLYVVDTSTPEALTITLEYTLPAAYVHLATDGEYIVLGSNELGVMVLESAR